MKRLSLLGGLFICALALFTVTSCEDPIIGPGANPPILDLIDDGFGSVTSDVDVAPGALLTFSISAIQGGDSPMKNVRFLEDGVLVDDFTSRLTINGSSASSANVLLFDAEKESFSWEVTWVAHSDQSARTYAIEVVDENGNSDTEAVLVNTVVTTPLSLTLVTGGGPTGNSLSADATLEANSFFRVTLEGIQGANALSRLEVQEDGVAISDLSRLYLNDIVSANAFPANPYALEGDDINGFVLDVLVRTHAEENVAKTYSFILVDDQENFEAVQLTITTNETVIPSDITELSGVLLNRAGPAGTGGLDLATGTGTGSSGDGADIQDAGIDQSLPNDQNWKQRIQPTNGSILVRPAAASDLTNNFANIQYKSEIENEYNMGTELSQSDVVNIGDVFLVASTDGNTYMIQCTNVNVTANDNADSYTFSVKY